MEMNEVIFWNCASTSGLGRNPSVMPLADEKVCQSPSTVRTSSYFASDQ